MTLRLVISRHGALRGDNTHLLPGLSNKTHTLHHENILYYKIDTLMIETNTTVIMFKINFLIIIFDFTIVGWY